MSLTYALISALILCSGYLCYRWIMADERQHGYNRVLLYIIYIVSLTAPLFLLLDFAAADNVKSEMIEIGNLTAIGPDTAGKAQSSGQTLLMPLFSKILVMVYLIGVAAMTIVSLFGLIALLRVIGKGEKIPSGKHIIVITSNTKLAPFSWLRYIVMNAADYAESGEVILEHERCHLRMRHWVDLIIAQAVICIQWFNPAAWLMRDELRNVHEYQADDAVIASGADISGYQKMLIKKAVGSRFQSFANSLNHSKLKKRVTMMYKEKSSAVRRISALLLAPALAAGCFVTAVPAVARVLDSFAEVNFASDSENKVTKISSTPEIKIPETVAVQTSDKSDNDENAALIEMPVAPTVKETAVEEISDAMINEDLVIAASEPEDSAPESKENKKTREICYAVDKMAEFPGGMPELLGYLANNIRYPEESIKNDEEGMVVIKFVVEADGSVSDAEVVKSVSQLLDAEAVRVVSSLPKWKPAEVKGKPVPVWFSLPIHFSLKSTKQENK